MKGKIDAALSKVFAMFSAHRSIELDDPVAQRYQRRCAALLSAQFSRSADDATMTDAFVVQGPLNLATQQVIAILRRLYPREIIVVSSWQGSDASLLAAIRPLCDAVVLSAVPPRPGGSNRNYQIVSTSAGIARARDLGADTIVKMRTDTCLLAPGLFALYRATSASIDPGPCHARGLRGRIIVPHTYTKKYFPFHVSDILMLGDAQDLAMYWSVPQDARELRVEAFSWGLQPLERIGLDGLLPETYLGVRFAETIGATDGDPLSDYWRLLRDHFIVVDDSWFDFYWLKRPIHLQPRAVDEVVTHGFWLSMYHDLRIDPAVWNAELDDARREGASFAYDAPPTIPHGRGPSVPI